MRGEAGEIFHGVEAGVWVFTVCGVKLLVCRVMGDELCLSDKSCPLRAICCSMLDNVD